MTDLAARRTSAVSPRTGLAAGFAVLLILALTSLFVGVTHVSPLDILTGRATPDQWQSLVVSRVPRTLAALLAGSALAMAGLLMQLLVRNRFVEPATVGTTESAALGLLLVTLLWPAAPLWAKMSIATLVALLGTMLFLALVRSIPPRSSVVVVPLVGMMLAGVISAVTTWIAYRYDLLQTLGAWLAGDFSGVLRGRYELLWLVAVVAVAVWVFADRFTVASLGESHATSLGLNYGRVLLAGLALVAVASATSLVVVGALPFLGLVVPNIVSLVAGDHLRRSLPWVGIGGAAFVLACDLVARTIAYPYEVPVGTIVAVLGAAVFLWLLTRRTM